jgi:hypothetical protein
MQQIPSLPAIFSVRYESCSARALDVFQFIALNVSHLITTRIKCEANIFPLADRLHEYQHIVFYMLNFCW